MMFDRIAERVFCINLRERSDRRARVAERFRRLGIEVEWIDGVKIRDGQQPKGWTAAPGCYGCNLSHERILRDFDGETCLIFEDDAEFCDDFPRRYAEAVAELPDDWQVFYLGCNHHAEPSPVSNRICRVRGAYTTHAYAIRRGDVDAFLRHPRLHLDALDVVLGDIQRSMPVYACRPPLVGQESGFSDILNRHADYSTLISIPKKQELPMSRLSPRILSELVARLAMKPPEFALVVPAGSGVAAAVVKELTPDAYVLGISDDKPSVAACLSLFNYLHDCAVGQWLAAKHRDRYDLIILTEEIPEADELFAHHLREGGFIIRAGGDSEAVEVVGNAEMTEAEPVAGKRLGGFVDSDAPPAVTKPAKRRKKGGVDVA